MKAIIHGMYIEAVRSKAKRKYTHRLTLSYTTDTGRRGQEILEFSAQGMATGELSSMRAPGKKADSQAFSPRQISTAYNYMVSFSRELLGSRETIGIK